MAITFPFRPDHSFVGLPKLHYDPIGAKKLSNLPSDIHCFCGFPTTVAVSIREIFSLQAGDANFVFSRSGVNESVRI